MSQFLNKIRFRKPSFRDSVQKLELHAKDYYSNLPIFNSLNLEQRDTVIQSYVGAYLAPLPMLVLGRSTDVWLPSALHNFSITAAKPFPKLPKNPEWVDISAVNAPEEIEAGKSLQIMLDELKKTGSTSSGSIIFDARWSLLANDAFIQGGIHSNKEIHIAVQGTTLSEIPIDKLFDQRAKRPRVLGRELLLASFNGYCEFTHEFPNLGIVLEKKKEKEIDGGDFFNIVKQLQSVSDFDAAFKESKK